MKTGSGKAAQSTLVLFASLAVFGVLRLSGAAQASPGRPLPSTEATFTAEQLRADFLQIRSGLELNHPAIYGFTDKAAFERLYEKQRGLIDRPMTLGEFYVIAAPLVVAVGCGHTRLSTPAEFWAASPDRFCPLAVRFFGDRAYVVGGDAPVGSEILSMNGRRAPEILADFKSLVSTDGSNDGNKTVRINAAFPWLYAHRFGYPEEFVVEIRPQGGEKTEILHLKPVAFSKIPSDALARSRTTSSGDPNLDFEILKDPASAAVLTIRDFSYYQQVDKFKAFIDDAFARIRGAGVRHLILDLRGNSGGDPFCTVPLLSYLEPKPVPYFARAYPGGYAPFAEPIPRAEGAFEGALFVLIDGGCFSSTGHIAAILKEHKIGIMIGAETGGTYECNDASREIRLANTRLRLFVARMTFTAAVKSLPRYRGVAPDVPVEPGIADDLAGTDPVLERALALIKK